MLPRCRPPAQTVCVALRRPLEIFSKMSGDSGTNAVPAGKKIKKIKVPSEVKKHSCSVVKLVYSIKPGSQAQLQQILLDEDRTT